MRDMWYICSKSCCEEPCIAYIEGGGHTGTDRLMPCLLSRDELRLETWHPLMQKDIDEYEISLEPMDDKINPQPVDCTCGYPAMVQRDRYNVGIGRTHKVYCPHCGRTTVWKYGARPAIKLWNDAIKELKKEERKHEENKGTEVVDGDDGKGDTE